MIVLREVRQQDLPFFFRQQLDGDANWQVAFTSRDPADRAAFDEHWRALLAKDDLFIKTIERRGEVLGYITRYSFDGAPSVAYWIGREYWGKGVATEALRKFLALILERPLFARAASDNAGSLRVLEKCGFVRCGEEMAYARARDQVIMETILRLDTPAERGEP